MLGRSVYFTFLLKHFHNPQPATLLLSFNAKRIFSGAKLMSEKSPFFPIVININIIITITIPEIPTRSNPMQSKQRFPSSSLSNHIPIHATSF